METKPKHGGARKGSGRKTVGEKKRDCVITVRVTDEEHQRFMELGGSAWLHAQLELKSHEPTKG